MHSTGEPSDAERYDRGERGYVAWVAEQAGIALPDARAFNGLPIDPARSIPEAPEVEGGRDD